MSFVDRSNTEWTPWPRLARVPRQLQVVGGVAAIIGTAAALFGLRAYLAPPLPRTMSKEWQEATKEMGKAKEREAAGPVELNPITRAMERR